MLDCTRTFLIGIVLSLLHMLTCLGCQNLTQELDYSQYKIAHPFIKHSCYLLQAQQSAKYSDSSLQAVSLYVERIIMQAPQVWFHTVDWKLSRFNRSSKYVYFIPQRQLGPKKKKSVYCIILYFPSTNKKMNNPNLYYKTPPGKW